MKLGSYTPWGKADSIREKVPGLFEVSTPGHGGYKLDRKLNAKIHPAWRKKGGWYEEDCEWAIVALTLGPVGGFTEGTQADARSTCRNYFPDQYEEVFGVKVTAEQSHIVRERKEKKLHAGKLQSFAAWGDWAKNVPAGMVGLCAKVDGRGGSGPERFFLLPAEDYKVPYRGVFVIPDHAVEVPAVVGKSDPFV